MYFVSSKFVFPKYRVQSYGIEQHLHPRDLRQISTLGAKMIPGKGKFIVEAFQRATKNPWSYLFLDYNQDCPDVVRMRSNILPCDKEPEDIFFLNTNKYY